VCAFLLKHTKKNGIIKQRVTYYATIENFILRELESDDRTFATLRGMFGCDIIQKVSIIGVSDISGLNNFESSGAKNGQGKADC
jgi:hypothetical protein